MKKKKIFVNGYADNNLGDDLFFDQLFTRYPNSDFYMNLEKVPESLNKYSNCTFIFKQKGDFFKFLSQMDVYVLIGGSMFQEPNSFTTMITRWLKTFILFIFLKFKKVKISCIGFNFGPIRTKTFIRLYKILFGLADYLSVRDEATFNLFKDNKKMHHYPDIVFGSQNIEMVIKKRESLGISIMDFGPNIPFQQEYNTFMIQLLKKIDKSIPVNIYGFQNSQEISDEQVINSILLGLDRNVNVILYNGTNLHEFIKSYGSNCLTVTTRFHSVVLSLLNKQRFLSVNYNIKVDNLLNMLDVTYPQVSIRDLAKKNEIINYSKMVNSFFEKKQYQESDSLSQAKINLYKKEANKHFEFLDKILISSSDTVS